MEILMEGKCDNGGRSKPTELSLTRRKATAEAKIKKKLAKSISDRDHYRVSKPLLQRNTLQIKRFLRFRGRYVSNLWRSSSKSSTVFGNQRRCIVFSSTVSRAIISSARTPSLKSVAFFVEEFHRTWKPALQQRFTVYEDAIRRQDRSTRIYRPLRSERDKYITRPLAGHGYCIMRVVLLFQGQDTVTDDNVTATEYTIDDENAGEITMEEIMKALKRMKVEKAAGYDRVLSEILGGGGGTVASLLYQLFNKCWKSHRVSNGWSKAVIIPLYKGKSSRQQSVVWEEYECGLRMDEMFVKCLLYADDQVIPVSSACGLQEMVNKMNDSVKKRGMKVNVDKTKVMVFERGESTTDCDILIEDDGTEPSVRDSDSHLAGYSLFLA
ncbi:hypothetical protein EVAR_82014_1 [Eumeta japonica]|uniref:Uncharacterized protein n=1 Tax=Eumeta variegata TaxID=151549 RepID=A0A4C1VXA2_EUMVA|nr:hypothetical protein EVAR_82014_1 [Eumeta japonica]